MLVDKSADATLMPSARAYREPWFWLLLSPMLTLIVSVPIMLTTAFRDADDRVLDDYYKEGRMINSRFETEILASQLGIAGEVMIDRALQEVWFITTPTLDIPTIELQLSHPAKAAWDHTLTLKQTTPGRFRAELPTLHGDRWYLMLLGQAPTQALPDGETGRRWRLHAEVRLDKPVTEITVAAQAQ